MRNTPALAAFFFGAITVAAAVCLSAVAVITRPSLSEQFRPRVTDQSAQLARGAVEDEQYGADAIVATWEPISPYAKDAGLGKAAEAVGLIVIDYDQDIPRGACTGTIIAPRVVVSALHCLKPPINHPHAQVESMRIVFDYLEPNDYLTPTSQDGRRRIFNLSLAPLDGAKGDGFPVDFALFLTEGNKDSDDKEIDPSSLWGMINISMEALTDGRRSRPLVVVHHPRGESTKQISRYSCHTNGRRIGVDSANTALPFGHACATDKGSSGAPILYLDTLELAGVHQGGIRGASRRRDEHGAMPNINAFSSVADMAAASTNQSIGSSTGAFALLASGEPMLLGDYAIPFRLSAILSEISTLSEKDSIRLSSALESLDFDPPESFEPARVSMIKFFDESGALGCNAFYVGGGNFLTTRHCLIDHRGNQRRWRGAPGVVGMIAFGELWDERAELVETGPLPWFNFSATDNSQSAPIADVAIFQSPEAAKAVALYRRQADPSVFGNLSIAREMPAVGSPVTLVFYDQSNSLLSHNCVVASGVNEDGNFDYDCKRNTLPGSSGGIIVDERGAVVGVHAGGYGMPNLDDAGYVAGDFRKFAVALAPLRPWLKSIEGIELNDVRDIE